MTVQNSVAVRNARLDAWEDTIGEAPLLRLYTGSPPASCADAATGDLLVEIELPTDWMAAASSGAKAKSGTWSGTAGDDGTAGYYRIYDATGTACHEQGTVTISSGGGDLEVDNTNIATGQTVTITSYTRTAGNA